MVICKITTKQLQLAIKKQKPRIIIPDHPDVKKRGRGYDIDYTRITERGLPIELKPSYRTIRIRHDFGGLIETFTLAFPYMQFFVVRFDNDAIPGTTCSLKSVSSWDEEILFTLPLPNIDNNSYVCLGKRHPQSAMGVCDVFWSTCFAPYELAGGYPTLPYTSLKSLENWEKMSKRSKHPLDVFKQFKPKCFDFFDFFRVIEHA